MKKLLILFTIACMGVMASCSNSFDDSEIRADIEDLQERVTALEKLCKEMNSNISAMQAIVNTLQNNDYITSVTPVTEGGETIGYTITFAKGNPITIYHGQDGQDGADGEDGKDGQDGQDGADGKDGYTPTIGVAKDVDDIYYWTLDGEWLLDENGNKIKAQGTDGADGQPGTDGNDGADGNDGQPGKDGADGITPQLKIENDYWYISYDNGTTWTQLGKATGEQGPQGDKGDVGLVGDSMFSDVDYSNEEYVIFTLSNGTTIQVPTWYAFEQLRTLCNQMNTNISALQTIVSALQNNDYVTKVEPVLSDGVTVGYTIYFTKSNPVTIYHGRDGQNGQDGADGVDGKDGYTPTIGVKQDTDGIYYWTLDGEWLLDENGNKIKAQGTDGKDGADGADGNDGQPGKDGADGITPQLKIENNYWYISYDNGSTWTQLGKATGEDGKDGQDGADGENGQDGADGKDGDSFFQSVDTTNSDYVLITLADGTQIQIPTWYAFEQLRTLCNQMNTNISALQTIVSALQNNDYVTKVEPVLSDGVTVGYTIYFTKSNPVTIYHGRDGQNGQDGADGKDGYTPTIGVAKDVDDIYYWTLDGEWLLDENGNKIKAQGTDGKDGADGADGNDGQPGNDGADGITPQLKIENNYWYISYDNGSTWTQLGKATGEDGKDGQDGADGENGQDGADGKDGDSFFQSVTQDEQFVYFTLADGTVITLPKGASLEITFAESDLVVMSPNSTREIEYTVTSVTDKVTVEVTSSADIKAKVVADDESGKRGKIKITTSATIDEYSKVIVFVSNGEKVVMKSISFEQAGITISNGAEQTVGAEGGRVSLNFLTNMDWEVVIPSAVQSWVALAPQTRAMVAQTATLSIQPNTTLAERTANITIRTVDGRLSVVYTIIQGVFDSVTATTPNESGWQSGDALSVFAANTKNQKYGYVGTAGAASGIFEATATATGTPTQMSAHYAVYPYNSAYTLSAEGVLSATLPSSQSYVVGGYNRAYDLMVGVSSDATDTDITLQPAYAYLCVKLWGKEQIIKSAVLSATAGEALSGEVLITPTQGVAPLCVMKGASSTITINCGELEIGTTEANATEIWFVVPSVALAGGCSLTVEGFYSGSQNIALANMMEFVAGNTYTVLAEVVIESNGTGMGVGGWGDGENIEGGI